MGRSMDQGTGSSTYLDPSVGANYGEVGIPFRFTIASFSAAKLFRTVTGHMEADSPPHRFTSKRNRALA